MDKLDKNKIAARVMKLLKVTDRDCENFGKTESEIKSDIKEMIESILTTFVSDLPDKMRGQCAIKRESCKTNVYSGTSGYVMYKATSCIIHAAEGTYGPMNRPVKNIWDDVYARLDTI